MKQVSRRVFRRVFIWTARLLAIVTLYGCAQKGNTDAGDMADHDAMEEAEPVLTVMSLDAEEASYQNYIHEAEEELGITIELQVPDHDANNRMALFSTQLSTGDDSVDVYTLNDEMLCEFKRKGYLAPLPEDLMEESVLSSYPQEYLREICMYEDSLYAAPFYMDIYMLWVNQEDLDVPDIEIMQQYAEECHCHIGGGVMRKDKQLCSEQCKSALFGTRNMIFWKRNVETEVHCHDDTRGSCPLGNYRAPGE